MPVIDINCDLGEGFGNYPMPDDERLMAYVSSVNIACGYHAGDPATMEQTVQAAIRTGASIGAHPGLPDLQGFGRREIKISPREAYQLVLYQIGALHAFVKAAGSCLHHIKPHGALYNMAAKDAGLAQAIANAVHDFDDTLILFGLSGSKMIEAADKAGLRSASEVFADRGYQDNGTLTPRTDTGAMITDTHQSLQQVLMMIKEQRVLSVNGNMVPIKAETVCIHGDGAHALDFAGIIHNQLKQEGILIQAPLR